MIGAAGGLAVAGELGWALGDGDGRRRCERRGPAVFDCRGDGVVVTAGRGVADGVRTTLVADSWAAGPGARVTEAMSFAHG